MVYKSFYCGITVNGKSNGFVAGIKYVNGFGVGCASDIDIFIDGGKVRIEKFFKSSFKSSLFGILNGFLVLKFVGFVSFVYAC